MKIRFELQTAFNENELRHPQAVMKELGIKYESSTPQSIADCWIFENCTNIPKELPKYLVII